MILTVTVVADGEDMLAIFGQEESGGDIDAHVTDGTGILCDDAAQAASIGATNDGAARICWKRRVGTLDRWQAH